jgi:metallo-beta-lactamase class B
MKRPLFFLYFMIITLQVNCQNYNVTIKISRDLELIKVSDNAYIHVSYANLPEYGRISANGLIFINNSEAFLFDSPWTDSLTMELVTYLNKYMGLRISGFIPNHWHNDCMGGLGYLLSHGIDSYANQKTIDIARSKGLPVPAHGFCDSLQISLGDKVIDCYFLGAAHSTDNIVVWLPSEKILFPGCMVKSLNSTNLGNTTDGDLVAYPETITKVLRKFKTAKIVIPGHGDFGGTSLIIHTLDLASKKL